MGCDIHMYLEHKRSESRLWQAVSGNTMDKVLPNKDKWLKDLYAKDPKSEARMLSWSRKLFYHGRNYALFAMLSNVRNDGTIESLCEEGNCDNDMPNDASNKIFNEYRGWGSDAHSLTVFTLQELLIDNKDFWEKETTDYDGKTCKYKDECKDFYDSISSLATHAKWKNLDKWRLVFWYDN